MAGELFALMFSPTFAYLLLPLPSAARLPSPLIAVFDEWKALGITTGRRPRAKHRRPASSFVVPTLPPQLATPQALGRSPPGSVVIDAAARRGRPIPDGADGAAGHAATDFRVLVPPARAETVRRAGAARGTQVQVVVPPGASPSTA